MQTIYQVKNGTYTFHKVKFDREEIKIENDIEVKYVYLSTTKGYKYKKVDIKKSGRPVGSFRPKFIPNESDTLAT